MLLPRKLTYHPLLPISVMRSFGKQQFQYLTARAPCCFISDACLPLNLPGRDVAASRKKQVQNIKPGFQRCGALREDGPRQRINVTPAVITGVRFSAGNTVMFARDPALRAVGHALGPNSLLDVFQTDLIRREIPKKIYRGVEQLPGGSCFRKLESRRQRGRRKRITCLQGIRPCCTIREGRRRTLRFAKLLCAFAPGLGSDSVASRNVDLDSDDKVIASDKCLTVAKPLQDRKATNEDRVSSSELRAMIFTLDLSGQAFRVASWHPPIQNHGLLRLTIPSK